MIDLIEQVHFLNLKTDLVVVDLVLLGRSVVSRHVVAYYYLIIFVVARDDIRPRHGRCAGIHAECDEVGSCRHGHVDVSCIEFPKSDSSGGICGGDLAEVHSVKRRAVEWECERELGG